MLEALIVAAGLIAIVAIIVALDGSKDAFHPLILIGPMFVFLYAWMPWKLLNADGLSRFFDRDQVVFVQSLNVAGIFAFVASCLAVGVRVRKRGRTGLAQLQPRTIQRLLIGGSVAGVVGLTCWVSTLITVGGFVQAYSVSYSGGWNDSGYVRDGVQLLLVGLLMAMTALSAGGPRWPSYTMLAVFGLPWVSTALLTTRRGPTFQFAIVMLMGWYILRTKRPPILLVAVVGACVGWFVLFLVTNRSSIYIGSDFNLKTDVQDTIEKPDTGNEWIYGAGTVLSAQRRDHYFWMRRYIAQIFIRPIPSSIWATKYEDFGVPELLHNAGTGEGFGDALGWEGAIGAAPGIVADLWVEVWWLAVPLMALLGWVYGYTWKRAVTEGGPWSSQLIVLSALSIYLVMQTMEAVIFRTLELSVPCWIIWRWSLRAAAPSRQAVSRYRALPSQAGGRSLDHA